jgi:hypothetical protein
MANRALIFALASRRALKLQVGGGVRSKEVIEDLLAHGVDRVVVDSISVDEPRSVIAWLKRFGCERLCLAFDVRLDAFAVPRVRTRGWKRSTPLDLWRAIKPFGILLIVPLRFLEALKVRPNPKKCESPLVIPCKFSAVFYSERLSGTHSVARRVLPWSSEPFPRSAR